MINFFKSDIETVKRRIKKPVIIASILMLIIIGSAISQGNFGELIERELLQTITLYFMIGGVWYGRNLIVNAGKAPIDENTGEAYYSGDFNGSVWRWGIAITLGATVGAVMFFIDAIRLASAGLKGFVDKQQNK